MDNVGLLVINIYKYNCSFSAVYKRFDIIACKSLYMLRIESLSQRLMHAFSTRTEQIRSFASGYNSGSSYC